MDALELSSQRVGGTVVITARGDLDIVTSHELDTSLTEARRGATTVILDLAAVDFMDTSSLAVVVGHWKKITGRGGTLALAGARYRYVKTLWITGLADRLPMFDTVQQAIAASSPDDQAAGRGEGQAAPSADGP